LSFPTVRDFPKPHAETLRDQVRRSREEAFSRAGLLKRETLGAHDIVVT